MRRFLIIQTSFIGDVVLATAIAEKLHRHFSESRIDVVVRNGNEDLFADHPFIHKVWIWEKRKNKFGNLLKLALNIRKQHYHEVINLQRYFSTGLLTVLSGGNITRGFDKNPLSRLFTIRVKHIIEANGTLHETERNQQLIADITGEAAARPKLYPSAADQKSIAAYTSGPYICCAPASVWFTKQYPAENWVSFISTLPENLRVYLLGARSDAGFADAIFGRSSSQMVVNLCGKLTFLQSAALMQQARMNFVNDSAPLHFASAVNAPVTAIFCSTVPQFGFGPLSDKRYIVQTDVKLDCKPCGIHGYRKCPLGHFKCGYTLHPGKLTEKIE